MTDFTSIKGLKAAGFVGFLPVKALRASGLAEVPLERGVYLILAPDREKPAFLPTGSGGHFKGKDPTFDLAQRGFVVCSRL